MRICFITCVFANSYRGGDKPGNFDTIKEFDYYLFTNLPKDSFKTSWNVINVDNQFNDTNIESNIIKSRYPKFMGWKIIKDVLKKDYDVMFYCDAYIFPRPRHSVDFWINLGKQIIEHPCGIMIQNHQSRKAYSECNHIAKVKKDTLERMNKTKDFLIKHNFPDNVVMSANTTFGYNPNNKMLTDMFSDFWNEYSTNNTSHRDQPLMSYFMWKHGIKKWPGLPRNLFRFDNKKIGFRGHRYV